MGYFNAGGHVMNFSLSRASAEWARRWYPAFSRRATQVCILSSALEKIALGGADAQAIALAALAQANAFDWKSRHALRVAGAAGPFGDPDIVSGQ
jgi:hypothetical protein